jgi:multiple sugar transport system substrate-binding protein
VIHPQAMDHDETDSMNVFGQRQVTFMRNWPVAYRNLQTLSSDDANQPPFFKITRLPGKSVLGGQNLAISSKSGEPKAARALIEFLTSPRSQQILFERGGFAATRELVYKDAEVQRQRPYAEVLLAAIEDAKLRPVHKHYVRFSKEFRSVVKEALRANGRIPPDASERLTKTLRD